MWSTSEQLRLRAVCMHKSRNPLNMHRASSSTNTQNVSAGVEQNDCMAEQPPNTHINETRAPHVYITKSSLSKSKGSVFSTYQRVLMCFFNRGDTEGTNSSKILCPMFVYVLFYVNLCHALFCGLWMICGLITCVHSK